jgi:hypothetical protein
MVVVRTSWSINPSWSVSTTCSWNLGSTLTLPAGAETLLVAAGRFPVAVGRAVTNAYGRRVGGAQQSPSELPPDTAPAGTRRAVGMAAAVGEGVVRKAPVVHPASDASATETPIRTARWRLLRPDL